MNGRGRPAEAPGDWARFCRTWWSVRAPGFSSPDLPDPPEEGQLHTICVCRPGSPLREDTHVFVFHAGQWLRLGNIGNPWSTDLTLFERMVRGAVEEPP